MHATSCEARDVDHCVVHRDRRQGRHQDVHLHRVHLHQERHQDEDRRNQDEHRLGHQDDRQGRDERLDQDVYLDQDDFLGLDVRRDQDGIPMGQTDENQEQCADLEEAEWGDPRQTWGQEVAESGDHQGVRLVAYLVAYPEVFHLGDPVVAPDVGWAAD